MSSNPLPETVLMLCNHNVIRSPMAEALMRKRFGDKIFVDSAGIRSGELDPFVTQVLAENDMDMSRHEPKTLEELDDTWFDVVIAFSDEAHAAVQASSLIDYGTLLHWPADDPTVVQGSRSQMLDAYRAVRDAIDAQLLSHFGDTSTER